MAKNDVSFILSFEILMAKMWIFGFSPRVCPTEPSNLVSSFGCLVYNGRQALLRGIRLGGSATLTETRQEKGDHGWSSSGRGREGRVGGSSVRRLTATSTGTRRRR